MISVSDKFEITEIIHAYSNHLDRERIDLCCDLFIDEGKLELRIGKAKGKKEIEILLKSILVATRGKRHFITNTVIEFSDSGEAFSQSYLLVLETINSTNTVMTGVYFDTFVKMSDSWKIHTRKLVVDLSF